MEQKAGEYPRVNRQKGARHDQQTIQKAIRRRDCGARRPRCSRFDRSCIRRTHGSHEHPVLGRLQFGPGSRAFPQGASLRDGSCRKRHLRSRHDQQAPCRRDLGLGSHQCQPALGARPALSREPYQAAEQGSVPAVFRQDAAGLLESALSAGLRRRRQPDRDASALRPVQLCRQHRRHQPRDGRRPGLEPVPRSEDEGQVWRPDL